MSTAPNCKIGPKSVDDLINDLRARLYKLGRSYDLFFAGTLKTPPLADHDTFDRIVKESSRLDFRVLSSNFKLNSTCSTCRTYSDLWRKKLLQKEEGKSMKDLKLASNPDDTDKNLVIKERVNGSQLMFDLLKLHGVLPESTSFKAFEDNLLKQKADFMAKHNAKDVEFFTTIDAGKMKLKARLKK